MRRVRVTGLAGLAISLLLGAGTSAFATGESDQEAGSMAQKEILFWDTATPGSKDHQWLTERVEIFMNENPDVVVKLEPQASIEIQTLFQVSAASGRGPDIMNYWTAVYTFPLKDLLIDIKDYVSDEQLDRFRMIYPSYYNYDPNEKLLGIPHMRYGFYHFIYNRAMFRDAGIEWEPTEDNGYHMTWDQFIEACEKLKAAGYTPLGWGNEGGWYSTWMISPISMQMYREKDDWIRHYKNEIKWSDPEAVEPMARVNELYQRGYFNEGGLTLGAGEGLQLVKNGEVAMQVMFWGIDLKSVYEEMGDDFGMMLAPVFYPDNPYADALFVVYPNNYVIPTWSKHPQESVDLLLSLYGNESMVRYHDVTGAIPIIKDFDTELLRDKWERLAWHWISTLEHGPPVDVVVLLSELYYDQSALSIEMFNGNMTPQEVGDAMQARVDELDYDWLTGK